MPTKEQIIFSEISLFFLELHAVAPVSFHAWFRLAAEVFVFKHIHEAQKTKKIVAREVKGRYYQSKDIGRELFHYGGATERRRWSSQQRGAGRNGYR